MIRMVTPMALLSRLVLCSYCVILIYGVFQKKFRFEKISQKIHFGLKIKFGKMMKQDPGNVC